MIEIPRNTYRVEDDSRIEEVISKCVPVLLEKGEVRVYMWGRCCSDEIKCEGDGREAVVEKVLEHFKSAGYHCAYWQNSCFKRLSLTIATKPIDREWTCIEVIC